MTDFNWELLKLMNEEERSKIINAFVAEIDGE
jgi:hypothetical protein